jgi:hypothetical protein
MGEKMAQPIFLFFSKGNIGVYQRLRRGVTKGHGGARWKLETKCSLL